MSVRYLAFASLEVAVRPQAGQAVAQAPADLLEELPVVGRPGPSVGALVQPEDVGERHLGIDGHGDLRLDAETLRQGCRQRLLQSGAEGHGSARSPHGLEHSSGLRIYGHFEPPCEGTGILRPGPLHRHAIGRARRVARVDEPRPVAAEDLQHRVEDVAHHLLEVVRPLQGPVDQVQGFEEPQVGQTILFGTPALGDVAGEDGDADDRTVRSPGRGGARRRSASSTRAPPRRGPTPAAARRPGPGRGSSWPSPGPGPPSCSRGDCGRSRSRRRREPSSPERGSD